MRDESLPLVELARRGDKGAFSRLVEGHRRIAAGIAYGILGDPHLAADAVQEAFCKAFQAVSGLKDAERFVPWFLTIVRSAATDMARRRVRWGIREVPMGDTPAEGGPQAGTGHTLGGGSQRLGPQEMLLQAEEASRIRAALLALPDEYREVIILKHLEGHSYQAIAGLLKTTVRAVESRLFRARQQLGRILGRGRTEVKRPVNGRRVPDSESEQRAPAHRKGRSE